MNPSRTMPIRRPDAVRPAAGQTVSLAEIASRAPRVLRLTDRLTDTREASHPAGGSAFNSSL
ncbi:hypothetical protein [Streptomyces scabiei]|uniref:hypothetical protein n=1 Tax=Streptomyces scabiei TaxID=1930 RepID=UPI0029A45563|nr:hypothetical protein [Streptomyces scabiei]MDX3517385.1 hypothetical protein [Streptomyces scabiei]